MVLAPNEITLSQVELGGWATAYFIYRVFFVLGKNTQIVGQEEDFWKVPVLDMNPFFFLEDKINELLFYWDKVDFANKLSISVWLRVNNLGENPVYHVMPQIIFVPEKAEIFWQTASNCHTSGMHSQERLYLWNHVNASNMWLFNEFRVHIQ